MSQLPTHYRNLNIPEDAGEADIRAAYRRLSQRYHPDRNPDDAEALRIMQLVNEAYRILSNPELRRRRDQWIAEQRRATPPSPLLQQTEQHIRRRQNRHTLRLMLGLGGLLGLLGLQLLWWYSASRASRLPAPRRRTQRPPLAAVCRLHRRLPPTRPQRHRYRQLQQPRQRPPGQAATAAKQALAHHPHLLPAAARPLHRLPTRPRPLPPAPQRDGQRPRSANRSLAA